MRVGPPWRVSIPVRRERSTRMLSLSTTREGGQDTYPLQELYLLAPWSQTSQPSGLWGINVCCLRQPVYDRGPSRLRPFPHLQLLTAACLCQAPSARGPLPTPLLLPQTSARSVHGWGSLSAWPCSQSLSWAFRWRPDSPCRDPAVLSYCTTHTEFAEILLVSFSSVFLAAAPSSQALLKVKQLCVLSPLREFSSLSCFVTPTFKQAPEIMVFRIICFSFSCGWVGATSSCSCP